MKNFISFLSLSVLMVAGFTLKAHATEATAPDNSAIESQYDGSNQIADPMSDQYYDQSTDQMSDESDALSFDRDHRNRWGHYQWVYDHTDRRGGCNNCEFTCGRAPRCTARIEGARMACKKAGTHNDFYVYRCARVRH
jgi:hypothetical protein